MGISRGLKVAQLLAGFLDGITLYVDRPFVPREYQCSSWLGTTPSVYLCNLRTCWLLHQDESVSLNEGGMEMDETSLYLFRRKQADRIKAMHWDGTGYIPLYKQPMEK